MSREARRARRESARLAKQERLTRASNIKASASWAWVVRASAFVRKELVEILRQPKLLALLVLGPFLLLILFGLGYRNTTVDLRTQFVGQRGSIFEQGVEQYADQLSDYITPAGFTDDETAARARLDRGEIDAVVVFPADALEQIVGGQRAKVTILHNKLDPFQQAAVSIAARVAVQEINASVNSAAVGEAQKALGSVSTFSDDIVDYSKQLTAAVDSDDPDQVASVAQQLDQVLFNAEPMLTSSERIFTQLGDEQGGTAYRAIRDELTAARRQTGAIADADGKRVVDDAKALNDTLSALQQRLPQLKQLDPDIVVRPFEAQTYNTSAVDITPAAYFTPGAVILLLQHLALTFAALSLVRDRQLGLFELLRVGPLSSVEILIGKTIAYLVIGFGAAAALIAAAKFLLAVPFVGHVGWVALTIALVLLSALALGMVISMISRTEIQAVQYAMLSLLAAMFFSGFMLSIDLLAYPVRYLAYAIPVTYGISMIQDVMLRGMAPKTGDIVGLCALLAIYGVLAVLLLGRKLAKA